MLSLIRQNIEKQHLISPEQQVLVAVSGGVDSIALFHLLRLSGYHLSIAHCNFQLRGEESEGDESFVRQLASEYQVPFYFKRFETREYAINHQVSIQMAARELRFNWFNELKSRMGFDKIALGHNLNDEVETFFINLLRGSGLMGLHGISSERAGFIRPMLFATREQILTFISENQFQYREDSSNSTHKYLRNRLRNQLFPLLEEIHPGGFQQIHSSIQKIKGNKEVYQQTIELAKKKMVVSDGKSTIILKKDLLLLSPLETYLFEFIYPFGFNETQVHQIFQSLNVCGKIFYSSTHQLLINREEIIIVPSQEKRKGTFYIEASEKEIHDPIQLSIEISNIDAHFTLPKSKAWACLDFEKLNFPLILRKWVQGDYFFPLGMLNPKKLSDFFIDQKFNLFEKENTWLLCSGEDICWVVGYRIDNRYKITRKTSKAYIVKIQAFE